jgi:uncharacterized protein with HEPN domain
MKREIGDYIEDISNAMDKSMKFIKDLSYDDFAGDDKTAFAVVRTIEIIGEAAKNVPESVRKKYPEIPWKEMAGMRDKVIHEYFGVDSRVVWETVKRRIPDIKPLFKNVVEKEIKWRQGKNK